MNKENLIGMSIAVIYITIMFSIPFFHDLKNRTKKTKQPKIKKSKWKYILNFFRGVEVRE